MAGLPHNMKEADIRSIVKKGELLSELDFERALMADRTLRILSKNDASLSELRNELRALLTAYESLHWTDIDKISENQLLESEIAEQVVLAEQEFLKQRKEIILTRLTKLGLIQKDLGTLLNHSKSYTSELLNGIRAFSSNDLILIHKLLKIDLSDLFPTHISAQTQKRIQDSMGKISSKKIRLKAPELELINS
jgi:transcriptional regulator with XRE-family HTH domain